MWAELEKVGLKMLVAKEHRLPTLTTVIIPDGVDGPGVLFASNLRQTMMILGILETSFTATRLRVVDTCRRECIQCIKCLILQINFECKLELAKCKKYGNVPIPKDRHLGTIFKETFV